MIKVDWLSGGAFLRVLGASLLVKFSLPLGTFCKIFQPTGKQGPVPEEMFQTLLNNTKKAKALTGRNTRLI
jgi:hypothetical protein